MPINKEILLYAMKQLNMYIENHSDEAEDNRTVNALQIVMPIVEREYERLN